MLLNKINYNCIREIGSEDKGKSIGDGTSKLRESSPYIRKLMEFNPSSLVVTYYKVGDIFKEAEEYSTR